MIESIHGIKQKSLINNIEQTSWEDAHYTTFTNDTTDGSTTVTKGVGNLIYYLYRLTFTQTYVRLDNGDSC
ncbi:hypothetical protein ACTXT7_002599 [Hymenolepis weldensis]